MNNNLLVFNVTFYLINFFLYQVGTQDPSASLVVVFIAVFFWLLSTIVLIIFIRIKKIRIKTMWDRIGIVTATPLLVFLAIAIARL